MVRVAVGCDGRSDTIADHPIPDSLTFDREDAIVVSMERGAAASAGLQPFAARLRDFEAVAGTDPSQPIGSVSGVRFLDDATFALLDQHASRVHVFDFDRVTGHATLRESFGDEGEGPGEFQFGVAVLAPERNAVWVLDGQGVLHGFDRAPEGEWSFLGQIATGGFPRDACELGDEIVVHTPSVAPDLRAEGVLRVVDARGLVGAPFAMPYRHGRRLVVDRMRRGMVACPAGALVAFALEGSNRVLAYDTADGTLRWHAEIEGVRIPRLLEVRLPDGRTGVRQDLRPGEGYHVLAGIESTPGFPVVLQYERFHWSEGADRPVSEGFDTFVLDPFGRGGLYVGDNLPRIAALSPRHLATLWEDPHPRVEVAEW